MEKPNVNISEFARIVGVDHAAVSRAIKRRERLNRSLIDRDGKTRIVIFDGCVEWYLYKDHRKDRRQSETIGSSSDTLMEPSEAIKLQRHFDAMMTMLDFSKEAGQLVPKDAHLSEVHSYARALRDQLLMTPNVAENEFKRLFLQLLRTQISSDQWPSVQGELDGIARSFRVFLKDHLHQVLEAHVEGQLEDS